MNTASEPAHDAGSVIHFREDEANYLGWLASNPSGFVLNVRTPPEKKRLMLHRATCKDINRASSSDGPEPFTGGLYSKVCSRDPKQIAEWARDHVSGVAGYTHLCKRCKPQAPLYPLDEALERQQHLLSDTEKSLRDTETARRERLKKASKRAKVRYVMARVFERNPDVIAEALHLARGICQGCGNPAPFERKATGRPYLEVHHVVPLAEGGDDTVSNAIALCPNCHRERHYG